MKSNTPEKAVASLVVLVFLLGAFTPVISSLPMRSVQDDTILDQDGVNLLFNDELDLPVAEPPEEEKVLYLNDDIGGFAPLDRSPSFYDAVGRIYKKPANYTELVSWYLNLEQNYSDYITVFKANELYGTGTVPKTGGGSYDLYYVRVTNESRGFKKPEVLFDGGPHGGEKIGAIGLYWTLDWLMRHAFHLDYDCPERPYLRWLLDNREIYFIIFHNPDGYDQNVRGDYQGRDLNREYDHYPVWGPFASVNGQTVKHFVNDHLLRTAVFFHTGIRKILYPWQSQHSTITGVSPISGKSHGHVPADFYFFDAAYLKMGDYIGDYGGDFGIDHVGSSFSMGMSSGSSGGIATSWGYAGNTLKHPLEDSYVQQGPYLGCGILTTTVEMHGSGNPAESTYGNDTIHRFGAEVRRIVLYLTDLAQPSVHWADETTMEYTEIDITETLSVSWLARGCLVVDNTRVQYGTDPDPISNPMYFTPLIDDHQGHYYGGSYWDAAMDGTTTPTVYQEELSFDAPGDYYVVAKAMVDQKYAELLRSDYYGDESYLRLIQERTNASFYESLEGADGLEEISGQIWWYSPVLHIRVLDRGNMWNTSFSYRRELTVDHTKVQAYLTNFPMLVELTDPDLAAKTQSTGNDIIFTDLLLNTLNHEIEYYDGDTGHLIAWVNVPSLSSTMDTTLYMFYGNETMGSQQNPAGVWDENYMMVQHLSETSGTHYDSTSNGNDGTPYGGVVQDATGNIDGANEFDGTDDYVQVPHHNTLTGFTEAMTASVWVKLDRLDRRQTFLNKYETATNDRGWAFDFITSSPRGFSFVASSAGGNIEWYQYTYAFDAQINTWYYVTVVWESNTVPKMFVNGQQLSTSVTGTISSIYNNPGTPLYIGKAYPTAGPTPNGRYLDGIIDEAQLSNISRSEAWIKTSYNNQANPSAFISIGEEKGPIFIFNPSPSDGEIDVQTTIASLSFNITHVHGKPMDYTVETSPDIGSKSETDVTSGRYTVPIDGLEECELYYWYVNVTDGTDLVSVVYSFSTECHWWKDWTYRKPITIPATNVESTLLNFPVLIDINDADLAARALSSGFDIMFTTAENQQLHHEIEYYDSGHLVAWVNVTTLSSEEDTIIYMYYGKADAEDQQNPSGVWDENYMMVQHLSETSGTHYDSTSNANDGAPYGGINQDTSGKIDGADEFDNIDDGVHIPHHSTLAGYTVGMTASAWVKLNNNNNFCSILTKYNTTTGLRGWQVYYDGTKPDIRFVISQTGGSITASYSIDYLLQIDTWYHIAVSWTSGQRPTIYVNGVAYIPDLTTTSPMIHNNDPEPLYIGKSYTSGRVFDGIIDEVCLSNIGRSQDWIVTSYTNQRDPGSFYAVGYETIFGNNPPRLFNENPVNNTVDVNINQATVNVTIEDPEGNSFDWTIEGEYINNAAGYNEYNGSKSATLITPLPYETQIIWYVNCTDSGSSLWRNAIYSFTTKDNNPPQLSNENPVNNTLDVSVSQSTVNVTIEDPDSDSFDWTIEGEYVNNAAGYNEYNGSKSATLITPLPYETEIVWFVNCTDSGSVVWTKNIYSFTTEQAPIAWWDTDWNNRRLISIDHTLVAGSLSNFPVLIDITNISLYLYAQANGNDFVFTDLSGNVLDHEIELYTSETGHLIAWVNIPVLSDEEDTLIFLYYGNPDAENQQNPSGVWDSHYIMVQHLNETTGTHYDSTINDNDGTPQGGVIQGTTGKIDGANSFDGTDDTISIPHDSTLVFTTGMTLSAWVKMDTIKRGSILAKYNTAGNQRSWNFEFLNDPQSLQLFASSDGTTTSYWRAAFTPSLETWYYVTLGWSSGERPTFYLNGDKLDITGSSGNNLTQFYDNALTPMYIGWSYTATPNRYWAGMIDEAQVSNINRSAEWIKTSYNNQNNPGGFIQVSADESQSSLLKIYAENPMNESTEVPLSLAQLSVSLYNPDYELMSYTIETYPDVGGSSGTNVGNGVITASINGLSPLTTYTWYVNVTDGTHTIEKSYWFETRMNFPPVFDTPTPTNGSVVDELSFTWSIPISDPDSDLFDWTIKCSNGQTAGDTADSDGTKTLDISGLTYETPYTVWVNATDPLGSNQYTRRWYTFQTRTQDPPVFGQPTPTNGSTENPLSFTWSIPISDPDGNSFDWTITCSNGQSNGANGDTDGTKSLSLTGLAFETLYTVWVNATDPDGSGLYTRRWYQFTTVPDYPPVISDPTPVNGSVGIPLSFAQLSVTITDIENQLMAYTIQTSPDIGSIDDTDVSNGVITLDITGLSYATMYRWYVNVTDGTSWTRAIYHFTTEVAPGPWWNTDWQYRRLITIDHTKVTGGLASFPVLISIPSDAGLADHALENGDDLVFTTHTRSILNHEIELFDKQTGQLVAWVNLPSLSTTEDTVLYLYYGNPDAENQQNPSGVWDSNYMMVQHLNETTGIHYDSTSNDNDGTPYGGINQDTTGKIDGADDFDGTNDYILIPHDSSISGFTEGMSASLWIKFDVTTLQVTPLCKYNTADNQRGWQIYYDGRSNFKELRFVISNNGDAFTSYLINFSATADIWYHIAATWSSGQVPTLYINGVAYTPTASTGGIVYSIYDNTLEPLYIGRSYGSDRWVNGIIDEVRISNIGRSAAWITTSYNNQVNPSAFYALGNQEIVPLDNQHVISLKKYWNLISVPFDEAQAKTAIIVRYNNVEYSWQDALDLGIILDYFFEWSPSEGYTATGVLQPRKGYWMWAFYDCDLILMSDEPEGDNVTLEQGWNLIGFPCDRTLNKETISVLYDEDEYTWAQATAIEDPLILGFVYGWHRDNQMYMLSDAFVPSYGYWLYAYEECTLIKGG